MIGSIQDAVENSKRKQNKIQKVFHSQQEDILAIQIDRKAVVHHLFVSLNSHIHGEKG
jgi:hypothetical protein